MILKALDEKVKWAKDMAKSYLQNDIENISQCQLWVNYASQLSSLYVLLDNVFDVLKAKTLLASLSHDIWSSWMIWMFKQGKFNDDGS